GAQRLAQRRQARGVPQDLRAQGGRRLAAGPRPREKRTRDRDRTLPRRARGAPPRSLRPQPLPRPEVLPDRPDARHLGQDRRGPPQPRPPGPPAPPQGLPLISKIIVIRIFSIGVRTRRG